MKKFVIILTIIWTVLPGYSQDSRGSRQPLPIIDMHLHTGFPHEVPAGAPALCRPEPCADSLAATTDPVLLMEKTREAMDRYNVVKAFLSGVDISDVHAWSEAMPDRFIAAPFILDPRDIQPEQLRKAYESGELQGLGEIGAQLVGLPPTDPSLEPLFQLAEELNVPVLIHTLGIGPYLPHFSSASGNPLLLEEILTRHPKLRLFVENAGYPFRDEMIAVMYQYPQLYVDVSTITWVIPRTAFYDYLEALVRAGLGKRILFGSDQMVWPEKIGEAIEAIEEAPFLTEAQKRDIFYNNAVRFLTTDAATEGNAATTHR